MPSKEKICIQKMSTKYIACATLYKCFFFNLSFLSCANQRMASACGTGLCVVLCHFSLHSEIFWIIIRKILQRQYILNLFLNNTNCIVFIKSNDQYEFTMSKTMQEQNRKNLLMYQYKRTRVCYLTIIHVWIQMEAFTLVTLLVYNLMTFLD